MILTWSSPLPEMRSWFVSGSRSNRTVGSSSMIRWEAWEIRSSSARVLGSMAKEIDGSGNLIGSNWISAPLADSVSPVDVTLSLAVAQMSPHLTCPAGTCSLPWRKNRPPSFSSASLLTFVTRLSGLIFPENTRISEIRPV